MGIFDQKIIEVANAPESKTFNFGHFAVLPLTFCSKYLKYSIFTLFKIKWERGGVFEKKSTLSILKQNRPKLKVFDFWAFQIKHLQSDVLVLLIFGHFVLSPVIRGPYILTLWHHHIHQSFHAVWCNIHYWCYMSVEIWLDWWNMLPFYRWNSRSYKRNMSISQVPRALRIPRRTSEAVRQQLARRMTEVPEFSFISRQSDFSEPK